MIKESQIKLFIEKITILEKSLGSFARFDFYNPIDFNPSDIISIQKLGKSMAEFVGLSNLTFIISIVPQEKNVGGHIDLSDTGNDVFIEISNNVAEYKDAVLATLAHEISHKILSLNGIRISVGSPQPFYERENEVLTDITAVFSGFGKQMINGCECSISYEEPTIDGKRKITKSIRTGYISREQFSFIYLMICKMRKIDSKIYLESINPSGKSALETCSTYNSVYFKSSYHKPSFSNSLPESFDKKLLPIKKELAEVTQNIYHIKLHSLSVTNQHLDVYHSEIDKYQKQFNNLSFQPNDNPSINFLSNANMYIEYLSIVENLDSLRSKSVSLISALKKVNETIINLEEPLFNSDIPTSEVIECNICKRKFKIPMNNGTIKAPCPTCKYVYLINTDPLIIEDEEKNKSKTNGFFKKLFTKK